jgi:hypothetical protein
MRFPIEMASQRHREHRERNIDYLALLREAIG